MSSQKVTGLASAFEPSKPPEESGVTTLASRFDAPQQQKQQQPQSKISDLASRFSGSDRPVPQPSLPIPSTSPKPPPKSPVKESPVNTPSPNSQQASRKVSDLSKAFSEMSKPTKSETFSAAHSTFEKATSSVSHFAKTLDKSEGPTAKVAGVARTFESRDIRPSLSPRFHSNFEKDKPKPSVEDKVDAFAAVASRFESGVAGQKDGTEQQPDAGKERFRDAAKMFGG